MQAKFQASHYRNSPSSYLTAGHVNLDPFLPLGPGWLAADPAVSLLSYVIPLSIDGKASNNSISLSYLMSGRKPHRVLIRNGKFPNFGHEFQAKTTANRYHQSILGHCPQNFALAPTEETHPSTPNGRSAPARLRRSQSTRSSGMTSRRSGSGYRIGTRIRSCGGAGLTCRSGRCCRESVGTMAVRGCLGSRSG